VDDAFALFDPQPENIVLAIWIERERHSGSRAFLRKGAV
jgi:hypothetical protein